MRIILAKKRVGWRDHTLVCELFPKDYSSPYLFYIRVDSRLFNDYERICTNMQKLLRITRKHKDVHVWVQEVLDDSVIRMFLEVMDMAE